MAGTSDASRGPDSPGACSQTTFQLKTNAIRNNAPFKTKSADIFASLETLEKDYDSTLSGRSLGGSYEETDEEEGLLEGFIKRGCIFRKPPASLGGSGPAGSLPDPGTLTSQAAPHSRFGELLKTGTSPSSAESLDGKSDGPAKPVATTASSLHGQPGVPARSDDADFRRPMSRDTKGRDTSGSGCRGRGRLDPRFAQSGSRRTPDHVVNPQKYTKYSLEETNMCGNSANRSIALGFLSKLRKRKAMEDEDGAEGCDSGQFVFKKPISSSSNDGGGEDNIGHPVRKKAYGSVYKMPEYEVGKEQGLKPRKARMTHSEKDEKSGFSLDHLQTEQPIDSDGNNPPAQSESSGVGGQGNTDQSDQGETICTEGKTFKTRKGKGRMQIRRRQEDT